jgi:hypothetical protein
MPGATVPYALPYPLAGDPTGPDPVQALAEAADALAAQQLADLQAARAAQIAMIVSGGPFTTTAVGDFEFVPMSQVVLNLGGMANLALNDAAFTIPSTGLYYLHGQVRWDTNTTGLRNITVNDGSALGDTFYPQSQLPPPTVTTAGGLSHQVSGTYELTAGTQLSLGVDSGAASRTALLYSLAIIRMSF